MKEEFSMGRGSKRILSLAAVFALAWLGARFLLPLLLPFALGLALALAAEPMVGFLSRRLPRGLSCALGVTGAFVLLTMAVLVLGAFLLRELKVLAAVLPDLGTAARSGVTLLRDWTLSLTDRAPEGVRPLIRRSADTLFSDGTALLDKAALSGLSMAGSMLSQLPDSALALGTGLISAYLISAKLPRLRRWVRSRIPRERLRAAAGALKRMRRAIGGWLLAQAKLMGVTFSLLLAGFLLLRIPHAPAWALGVALVDAFPVLGTGTVLLPWSLLWFIRRDAARALGLLGLYITITLTRSALEPKLLGRHLGLDPLATLMALYIGYRLWGIGGMILSPLLAVTALQLVPERK